MIFHDIENNSYYSRIPKRLFGILEDVNKNLPISRNLSNDEIQNIDKEPCSGKHVIVSDNMSSAICGDFTVFFISVTKHQKNTNGKN